MKGLEEKQSKSTLRVAQPQIRGLACVFLFLFASLFLNLSEASPQKTHGLKKTMSSGPGLQLLSIEGKPLIEVKNDESNAWVKKRLQLKDKLRGRFVLHTDSKSFLRLQLDDGVQIKIFPSTEVDFPLVPWETGKAEEIVLVRGQVRWENTTTTTASLRTPLFEIVPPLGVFLFDFQPESPEIEVMVFEKELNFAELHGEEPVLVKEGQKIHFQGAKEDGEIVYDLLLKGKKIPKGQKSAVVAISPEEQQKYSRAAEVKAEAEKRNLAAKKKKILESKNRARPGEICSKPRGKFEECAWICENKKGQAQSGSHCHQNSSGFQCVRYRCNASGVWSDPTIFPASQNSGACDNSPRVSACDY